MIYIINVQYNVTYNMLLSFEIQYVIIEFKNREFIFFYT